MNAAFAGKSTTTPANARAGAVAGGQALTTPFARPRTLRDLYLKILELTIEDPDQDVTSKTIGTSIVATPVCS